MSATNRKKKRRNKIIRLYITGGILLLCLGVVIYGARDLALNGISALTIQLGIGLIVLFFGAGYFISPVLKEIEKQKGITK